MANLLFFFLKKLNFLRKIRAFKPGLPPIASVLGFRDNVGPTVPVDRNFYVDGFYVAKLSRKTEI